MVQTIQREFRSGCVKSGADLAKSIGSRPLLQCRRDRATARTCQRSIRIEAFKKGTHASTRAGVDEYDLVILGGGTEGTVAAWTFATQGQRVAVIERKYIGGNVSKKLL